MLESCSVCEGYIGGVYFVLSLNYLVFINLVLDFLCDENLFGVINLLDILDDDLLF